MNGGSSGRWLAIATSLAVAASVLAGLYLAGSPAEARLLRLDDRRVDDLRSIMWATSEYWRSHGHLPPALDSLPLAAADHMSVRDPVTGVLYGFTATGDSTYSLCAAFARPSPSARDDYSDAAWRHTAGQYCFPLVAGQRP